MRTLSGLLCVAVLATGVSAQDLSQLEGRVAIDGSSTVYPISQAIAEDFTGEARRVRITVGVSGTGGGFKVFSTGETDISDASRPIKAEEFQAAVSNGVKFYELPVAYDGLTIVVHASNDWVKQLTVEQLQKIFLTGDSMATTWSDLDPSWPDSKIEIYAPGTDSGTFDYFKEVVAGKSGSFRGDMATSEDDNVLVTGVAGNKAAIGFFGAAYYEENKDKLKAVPIVNAEGKAVLPTAETIESGEYNPFSRPLFIYVNADSYRRSEVRSFVDFYLENAGNVAEEVGYVSLPGTIYDRAREVLKKRMVGTAYTTKDGGSREGAVSEVYQPSNLTKEIQ